MFPSVSRSVRGKSTSVTGSVAECFFSISLFFLVFLGVS